MSSCSSCSKAIPSETVFCPHCGAHLGADKATSPKATPVTTALSNLVLLGIYLPIWCVAGYVYLFIAAAHGQRVLPSEVIWLFGIFQVGIPVAIIVSVFAPNGKLVGIPGLMLLVQIAGIAAIFLVG